MKKETLEKFKKLPLTHKGMTTAISYALSVFLLIPIILALWIFGIDIPTRYFPVIFISIAGLDFLILKKWFHIAEKSKDIDKKNIY